MTKYLLIFTLFLSMNSVLALDLGPSELQALKNDMTNRPETEVAVANNDVDWLVEFYNGQESTGFAVWHSGVPPEAYKDAIVWSEFDAVNASKRATFDLLTATGTGTFNAAIPNVRAGIRDVFSASAQVATLSNLEIAMRRYCTEVERLYVSGSGPELGGFANPGTAQIEGLVTPQNIVDALAL